MTSIESQTISAFPSFVSHETLLFDEEFNSQLVEYSTHFTSGEDFFAGDAPVLAKFERLIKKSMRDFVRQCYLFDYSGEISLSGDVFLQTSKDKKNFGIDVHDHRRYDVVATYYPLVTHSGSGLVRFYDPARIGARKWVNKNSEFVQGYYHQEMPETGSLILFDAHLAHDSEPYLGVERMAIPVSGRFLDRETSEVHAAHFPQFC